MKAVEITWKMIEESEAQNEQFRAEQRASKLGRVITRRNCPPVAAETERKKIDWGKMAIRKTRTLPAITEDQ